MGSSCALYRKALALYRRHANISSELCCCPFALNCSSVLVGVLQEWSYAGQNGRSDWQTGACWPRDDSTCRVSAGGCRGFCEGYAVQVGHSYMYM